MDLEINKYIQKKNCPLAVITHGFDHIEPIFQDLKIILSLRKVNDYLTVIFMLKGLMFEKSVKRI
jgi:hypothetical protein